MNLPNAPADPPLTPDGIDLLHRFDLGPLPPDAMMRQEAVRWIEAEQLTQAMRQGAEDARLEAQAFALPDEAYGQVG